MTNVNDFLDRFGAGMFEVFSGVAYTPEEEEEIGTPCKGVFPIVFECTETGDTVNGACMLLANRYTRGDRVYYKLWLDFPNLPTPLGEGTLCVTAREEIELDCPTDSLMRIGKVTKQERPVLGLEFNAEYTLRDLTLSCEVDDSEVFARLQAVPS